MSITVPRMFMLSHASWVNHERYKARWDKDRITKPKPEPVEEEEPTYNGKPLRECSSEEMKLYYGNFFMGN
jgi:hypothetical protein